MRLTFVHVIMFIKNGGRKRRVITLDQKLNIIDDLRKGKPQQLVSDTFGVPKPTIGDIWKEQEKIENYVSMSDCPSIAKKNALSEKQNLRNWTRHASYAALQGYSSIRAPTKGESSTALPFYLSRK